MDTHIEGGLLDMLETMYFKVWIRQHMEKQRHYFANRGLSSQGYGFSSGHVGCESWTTKKAECRRLDAFELWFWRRLFKVPWTARRSNQSILKEVSWVFIGRTDAEAETPILWLPDTKSWLIWKDPDAWKDWGQEKGTTEDEMVGLSRHGFGWTLWVDGGQEGPVCCGSWGHKESDTAERLSWTKLSFLSQIREEQNISGKAFSISKLLSSNLAKCYF